MTTNLLKEAAARDFMRKVRTWALVLFWAAVLIIVVGCAELWADLLFGG